MTDQNMLFAREDEIASALFDTTPEVLTDKYLIFESDDLLFGAHADHVSEIITNISVTHLPMVPHYVCGIINLRGQIVPILDLRLLLGKKPGEKYATVVLNIDGTQIGVLVDRVDQMIDLPKSSILPVPRQNAQRLISGMCTLPGGIGTMMVLDCPLLLHES